MPKLSSWFQSVQIDSLLNSRAILYLFLFISIFHLLFFVMSGNYVFCIFFFLIGFLTTFFSKNMIVVMFISLVSTGLLHFVLFSKEEGFESKGDTLFDEEIDMDESSPSPSPSSSVVLSPSPTLSPSPSPSSSSSPDSPASVPSPVSLSARSLSSPSPQVSPATAQNLQSNVAQMANIQLKMLQNIQELRPIMEDSKKTLQQIKQYTMSQPAPSSTPASAPSVTTSPSK